MRKNLPWVFLSDNDKWVKGSSKNRQSLHILLGVVFPSEEKINWGLQ